MSNLNKLLVALLVVQAAIVMGMRMSGDSGPKRANLVTILPDFDKDKVTAVTIAGAPKQKDDDPEPNVIQLSKVNGNWGIADADQYPTDGTKVDDLLSALGKLKSRTVVVTSAKYYDKLEVSPTKYQRKITVKQDSKETTFFVGTSPSFKNVHVRVDGQDNVMLVNDFGTTDANDRAWAWVDRKYQDFPEKDVWAVNITNKNGNLVLEKDPASSDWAAVGVTETLDKSAVTNLISKARAINLEAPVSKAVKPEFGFDAALATVVLTTGTSTITGAPPKTTETVTVQVGKKLEKDNQYYVKSSKNEYVVKVAGWAIEPLLEKAKADLIKKEE